MQPKEQRDAAVLTPASASDAVLSTDPRLVEVMDGEGNIVTWESRRGFGVQQQKLAYADRPGFHRHWFNDEPGRLVDAKNAGYTQVVGDDGKVVFRVVDKGTGMRAYLHEIPEVWYKADMAEVQKRADAVDAAVRAGNAPGLDGSTPGINPQKGFYGKISVSRKATG